MVKKIGILGFILVVVAAAGMVWAETYTGSIPAPQPMVVPAAAPACVGPNCAPPPPPKVKAAPAKLRTSIQVKMSYPEPAPPPMMYCGPACGPPPIPVAVPMWRFIVPWPPFVYYLPVD
ncbi:MAG: hypothetical protein QG577_1708 [Thermodesulfobacteriota bacterium]|nr:hypothetical protein [Thermodesulfobacteriota bacterium]